MKTKMKTIRATTLLITSISLLASCGDKKTTDNHEGHDHEGHDHSKHEDKDAHADHDHDDHSTCEHEVIKAGPNGGRMIEDTQAEFFVTADRHISITFYDADGKVIDPTGKTVTVVTGKRPDLVEITFEKADHSLTSTQVLPEGNNFPTAIEIGSGDKNTLARFTLNLSDCPECENKEYACECEHAH